MSTSASQIYRPPNAPPPTTPEDINEFLAKVDMAKLGSDPNSNVTSPAKAPTTTIHLKTTEEAPPRVQARPIINANLSDEKTPAPVSLVNKEKSLDKKSDFSKLSNPGDDSNYEFNLEETNILISLIENFSDYMRGKLEDGTYKLGAWDVDKTDWDAVRTNNWPHLTDDMHKYMIDYVTYYIPLLDKLAIEKSKRSTTIPLTLNIVRPVLQYRATDKYYVDDFLNEMRGKVYQAPNGKMEISNEDMDKIVRLMSRCIAIIHTVPSPMYFYKEKPTLPFAYEGSPHFHEKYTLHWENHDGKHMSKSYAVSKLMYDVPEITYREWQFIPFHEDKPIDTHKERIFNVFPGFKAKLVPLTNESIIKIQPIMNHIYEVWACENLDWYKWIITWLAYPFRNLKQSEKVLVLTGDPGVGKSCILDEFLAPLVYGSNLIFHYPDLGSCFKSDFNEEMLGKMYIHFGEVVAVGDTTVSKDAWGKLKELITGKEIMVHPKGKKKLMIPNKLTFSITSNFDHCIQLDQGDRRYGVFHASPKYRRNWDYFKNLYSCFTQENADIFYSFLRSQTIEPLIINIEEVPDTPAKINMLTMSKPKSAMFLEQVFLEKEYPIPAIYIHPIPVSKTDKTIRGHFITCSDLYSLYCDWWRETKNGTQWSDNAFGKQCQNVPGLTAAKTTVQGQGQKRGYFIDPSIHKSTAISIVTGTSSEVKSLFKYINTKAPPPEEPKRIQVPITNFTPATDPRALSLRQQPDAPLIPTIKLS